MSVVATIGYLANLGGPPAIGALSDAVGRLNAFWLVAALLAAALVAASALRPPRTPTAARPLPARQQGEGDWLTADLHWRDRADRAARAPRAPSHR